MATQTNIEQRIAANELTKQERFAQIKRNIATSYMYQKDNNKRFHEFRKYVYKSSISDQQRTILAGLRKPAIEANMMAANISRLKGEFAMHEPSIEVTPSEGIPVAAEILDIVEGHIRHNIYEANKNSFSNTIYEDILSGGLSAFKVYTDFATQMSFHQNIFMERSFDPTMVGFDPMARHSHKGDGQYSFEIFPMTDVDFAQAFPNADKSKIKYTRRYSTQANNIEGFNWSYKNAQQQNTVLIVEYYEKRKKRTKIVKLADGRTMTAKTYKAMIEDWEEKEYFEQIPVVLDTRMTDLETVICYRLNECEILEEEDTDYAYLPHIFVAGNAILLTEGTSNCTYEMTTPYIYHARGIQDLKNFSMQTLANSLENQTQSKFIIMKEALPQEQDYIDNITNIQMASTIVVNAFNENNPDQPIPNPIREVVNVPCPPEVMGTFSVADPTMQSILGSFASNLGRNDADLSGKAIIETATVGNSAAMPYMIGYLAALKQAALIIVDLMPKYLRGDRTIPVVSIHGDKEYKRINAKGHPQLNYEEGAIRVNIEPGVSFNVQKSQSMTQITQLMAASEQFAGFMNSPKGLPVLINNLTCYGSDQLKEAVPEYLQQMEQQQQQAMQMKQQEMMMDPRMIKAKADEQKNQMDGQIAQMKMQLDQQKLALDAQKQQMDTQIELLKIKVSKELADAKTMEIEAKIGGAHIEQAVKLQELEVSQTNHQIDAAVRMAEMKTKEHDLTLKVHEAALNEHKSGLAEKTHMLEEKRLEHEIKQAAKEPKVKK